MSDDEFSFDETQANLQVSLTDTNRRQRAAFTWAGVNASLGRTDFEGYQLNAMLDMIESARPGDLEAAADALASASDAIEGVGEDIKKYAANVDWEGESGDAFRTWADNLGKNTLKLATYTGQAGVQMRAASIGLASVKSGMPPRERGPYLPMDIEKANAAEDPREKNRQEAITQMNRLSSFYTVSRDTMAAQEEPTFAPPPDVGVPKADSSGRGGLENGGAALSPEAATEQVLRGGSSSKEPSVAMPSWEGPTETPSWTQPVVTEINNASPMPTAPVERFVATPNLTAGGLQSVPNGLPLVPPAIAPQRAPEQRTRSFSTGGGSSGSSRRHDGTPASAGRPPGPSVGSTPPAGPARHANLPSRTGRTDPVLGGMPYRPASAAPTSIPQGTVAGTERGSMGRSPMVGQPGGAGPARSAESDSAKRRQSLGGGSDAPRVANQAQRSGSFTSGGMGLVNRPVSGAAEKREITRDCGQSNYLTEDEETWKSRRGIVPPVVD
ncbi:hypothetical protein GCM10023347_02860 [Streptomyces chumphonensis]|uniref:Uncharacterized protein n=1 Tax=Streptomyces chumphonensis TaxID=1214925 RepID=A0A927IFB8_9ACTN|nr:hypothetical protein [Streptomyces chumphonensis]MBD3934770.1 hypothetical protein [Streptomyces chumphonensis]